MLNREEVPVFCCPPPKPPPPPNKLFAAGCCCCVPKVLVVFCGWLVPKRPPPPNPVGAGVVPKPVPAEVVCWVGKLNAGLFAVLFVPKRPEPVVEVFVPNPELVPPNPVVPVPPNRPVEGCVGAGAPNTFVAGGFWVPNRPPLVAVFPPNPLVAGWDVPNGELDAPPPNKFEVVPVLAVPKPVFVDWLLLPNPPKPVLVPNAPA